MAILRFPPIGSETVECGTGAHGRCTGVNCSCIHHAQAAAQQAEFDAANLAILKATVAIEQLVEVARLNGVIK